MSLWTDNAARFASTPEATARAHQHDGVRATVALLTAGRPEDALARLVASVERQARLLGASAALPLPIGAAA